MKFSRSTKYLFIIFFISFVLYLPSLSTFYTHDDFFHLSIANANSLKEFINFFSLTKAPEGWGLYRPLTTQVFYFLTIKFFNLNPLPLHFISFGVLFINIFLVHELARVITRNTNTSLLTAFLYGASATHFGHMYFLGAFQELGMALFFLVSVLTFVKFEFHKKLKFYLISFASFGLALLSKESAVVLPFVLFLVWSFGKAIKKKTYSFRNLVKYLIPYFGLLAVYFFFRIKYYGFAQGESYIWDFSIGRLVNTLGWYGIWSFNLPEMLVDFVQPGLKFNPNLFKFWSKEIIPIFILFATILLTLLYKVFKNLKKLFTNQSSLSLFLFCIAWFFLTLLPVLFLPLHKFTFYLTLPLIGIVILTSYLLTAKRQHFVASLFMITWLILSFMTLGLTRKTHWITQGAETAQNVHNYFIAERGLVSNIKTIAFYDTQDDIDLPWSPTALLKVVLSDQNYFKVFWKGEISASYSSLEGSQEADVSLKSRQFLGY